MQVRIEHLKTTVAEEEAPLGENITQEVAKYIANKQKEYENENPSVVFNDNGFVNDNEKLNSIEILKNNGFNEEQLMSI
jgi:adenine-specific DNA-methyltransferase